MGRWHFLLGKIWIMTRKRGDGARFLILFFRAYPGNDKLPTHRLRSPSPSPLHKIEIWIYELCAAELRTSFRLRTQKSSSRVIVDMAQKRETFFWERGKMQCVLVVERAPNLCRPWRKRGEEETHCKSEFHQNSTFS